MNELTILYEDNNVYAHVVGGEAVDESNGDVWTTAVCGVYIGDDAEEYDPTKFPVFDAPGICPYCIGILTGAITLDEINTIQDAAIDDGIGVPV